MWLPGCGGVACSVCGRASRSSSSRPSSTWWFLSFERPCGYRPHRPRALLLGPTPRSTGAMPPAGYRGILNNGVALSTHHPPLRQQPPPQPLVHASSKQATAVLSPPRIHTDEAYEAQQQQQQHQERQPDRPCASPPTSCWCVSFACESPGPGLGGGAVCVFAALCAVLLRPIVASLFSPQRDHPSTSLQHARAFINAVKDRELDLRGACAFARIDHHQPRSLARTPRHD